MMAKQTMLDKVIAALETERAVLDVAIAKLKQQQAKAAPRKPRIVKAAV
jgi:peptidoglycan hydrolase CwlO-like protein